MRVMVADVEPAGRISLRPVQAEIDLDAVADNLSALKSLVAPSAVMAVVKANGYGLGATQVAGAALSAGAGMLGVACTDEGVALRRDGIEAPILVMGFVPPEEAYLAVENKLAVTLHRTATAYALNEAAERLGLPGRAMNVHIKVDTGLGRYGCLPEEFANLASRVAALPHLHLQGLMTHFAEADAPDLSFSHHQLQVFENVRREAVHLGLEFDYVHAANTAAALALPESRFDMVRSGLLLGGNLPATHLRDFISLRPAFTLMSRVARVFRAEQGQTVGYGRTWTATMPSLIGLVPLGYADGYPRSLSNRGEVLVRGLRCHVAGRVSMDQISVDLTNVPNVSEGDEVVLIGRQGDNEITIDEVAGWAGTISYEILCGISRRVPRGYTRGGQTVAASDLLRDTFIEHGRDLPQ
ncbi:MAG TPA: alanine racemase [Chloroflexia bacterium]|nr:alanine racemase [Chloroflexia bacterium]